MSLTVFLICKQHTPNLIQNTLEKHKSQLQIDIQVIPNIFIVTEFKDLRSEPEASPILQTTAKSIAQKLETL